MEWRKGKGGTEAISYKLKIKLISESCSNKKKLNNLENQKKKVLVRAVKMAVTFDQNTLWVGMKYFKNSLKK